MCVSLVDFFRVVNLCRLARLILHLSYHHAGHRQGDKTLGAWKVIKAHTCVLNGISTNRVTQKRSRTDKE